MDRINIPNYTVSSFIHSKAGKQLSTKRVLCHIENRLSDYSIDNRNLFQNKQNPVSVALCPTSLCIRNCSFCSNKKRNTFNRLNKCMYSESIFYDIISDLKEMDIKGVSMAGGGEPFCYDEKLLKFLFLQKSIPYKIGIHTNGMFLDKYCSDQIISTGNIAYINVSVFAHNRSLYNDISEGGETQFSIITDNILKWANLNKTNSPSFGVKILICRENYKHIAEIVDFYKRLQVDNILLRCVGNFEEGQDVELNGKQQLELGRILKAMTLKKEQISSIIGKPIHLPPRPSRCWIAVLQYTAGIDPDGEVYICSPWSFKEYSIGNVNNEKFSKIWGSCRHQKVVEKLNFNLLHGMCNPLTCRHYYSNIAIDAYINGLTDFNPDTNINNYNRFI